jgi:CDP-diacylglycerol---glycerol-3-phosphate 3-phosphatidyltransferase
MTEPLTTTQPTTAQRPRKPAILSVANQLTASRLVLSIGLFALIAVEQWLWALVVFALAAVTDWLDGYFARTRGQTSALGRVFDPLVDKVLVCGAFIFLLPFGSTPPAGWLTPWMVTVVVAREFLITGLRGWLESLGVSFGADWLGKLKMTLQCAAIIGVLVAQTWSDQGLLSLARDVLIYAMLAATILSGLQYVWRGVLILRNAPEKTSAGG